MCYKKLLAIMILVPLVSALALFSGCEIKSLPFMENKSDEQVTRETEELIKNSPTLQEVDRICSEIKLPEDFQLVWKSKLHRIDSLSYHYKSEFEFSGAKQIFVKDLTEKGWEYLGQSDGITKDIKFRKENKEITIFYGGMGDKSNYSINCS